jgi:hypothetical protein
MQLPTATEWFGLKNGKFEIDPRNAPIMAFNKNIAQGYIHLFKRQLIMGNAPKLVLFKNRGDGKTHIANYILRKLEEEKLCTPVYLECPAMSRRSNYLDLHKEIFRALVEKKIFGEVIDALAKGTSEKSKSKITDQLGQEFANAYTAYRSGEVSEGTFMRYLYGNSLAVSLMEKLNVSSPLDSMRAVDLLVKIAENYQKLTKKTIILNIDETDNLKEARVGSADLRQAIRRLAEAKVLGLVLVYNLSAGEKETSDRLPLPLRDPGVMTRIGTENYRSDPPLLKIEDLEDFVKEVSHYSLMGREGEIAKNAAKKQFNDDYADEFYPFTKSGFAALKSKFEAFLKREKERGLRPRAVQKYIQYCLGEAILKGKHAIDAEVVKEIGDYSDLAEKP